MGYSTCFHTAENTAAQWCVRERFRSVEKLNRKVKEQRALKLEQYQNHENARLKKDPTRQGEIVRVNHIVFLAVGTESQAERKLPKSIQYHILFFEKWIRSIYNTKKIKKFLTSS